MIMSEGLRRRSAEELLFTEVKNRWIVKQNFAENLPRPHLTLFSFVGVVIS